MKTLVHLTAERRFEIFMDAAFDYAIFFTDVDGAILEWSVAAQRMMGYTEDEVVQLNGRAIFTAEDRGRRAPELEMETAIRNGQANDERWHVRKDGTLFFAVGRLVALRDEADELVGFTKVIRDATPHKSLEQALRASDQNFRATFAQAPIGMVLTDLKGRVQQVNAHVCQLTGFAARELEGRDLISLTIPEDRAVAQHQMDEMFAGNRDHVLIEKRMQRADGSHIWVQNSAAILRDAESRPMSVIDLMQDISVLKLSAAELARIVDERTAALGEKTKQMEAFCYTVAHDLRAPLRAIAGYAELLRQDFDGALAADGLDYLQRIEAAAGRLDRLISDLLGYTRMQQVALVRHEVDLTEIATRVAEQVKRDHPNDTIAITVHAPLGTVRADSVTLEHVFLNLVSNAVKFRRDETPAEIHIRAEERGALRRIWVEDNGIGIDPRFHDRAFAMF
ncbi:MAG TPA: PAS domain S-box protein, partial [Opitutaceae bacterium]|nr:PAS domain S-box protein [Opitutaceae bacterium]